MNPTWSTLLSEAGARFDNDHIRHFGKPHDELRAVAEETIVCPLIHYGMLAATGPDADNFLQGQVTTDTAQLKTDTSQLTAWCNAKGRMLACLRLSRTSDDTLYLRLPATLAAPVRQRLQMFVLRARVELRDVGSERIQLGLAGAASPTLLASIMGRAPAAADTVIHTDGISAIRLPGPSPRFELHGRFEPARRLWQLLANEARAVGTDAWDLGEVRAGLPEILPATQDTFIPQMVNLDLLGGVHFDKGCYVGQEVIARTRYLGRLKRRMQRLRFTANVCPAPGTELFVSDPRGPQSVGQIVQAAPTPEGGFEALAVIASEQAGEELHLGNIAGPAITLLALPYPLT